MGCCGRVRGNPEMERQEPCFLVRCKKKRCTKNSVRPPFLPRPPRRRASALHLCQRSATAAPARPQHPCHPLGSARCSLVCFRARRVHASGVGGGPGTRTAAVQQELHSERQPAPAAVHRENPLAGPPDPCARPLARPFLPHRPRAPQRPPQRAAPCTAHRSYKTSRDTHRTCAAAPTRPQRTRCSREGIDAQAAHWQVSGGTVTPARRSKGGTRCVGAKSPSAHTSIGPRAHPLSRA